jgi:hypothetical protein
MSSNFDTLPEDEKNFVLDGVRAATGLPDEAITALLANGWSYIEDGDGHRWTINALDTEQTVQVMPDKIAIPEVLIPGVGAPINALTVGHLYNHFKPDPDKMTAEEVVLMAILRSVYQGYQEREQKARQEKDAESKQG